MMPEAPEVERVVGQIHDALAGRFITSVDLIEGSTFYKRIKGSHIWKDIRGLKLLEASRKGKMIWFDFESHVIVISLGMTGSFRIVPANGDILMNPKYLRKHDHFYFLLDDRDGSDDFLVYNDPRKFGSITFMTKEDFNKKISKLGPDIFEVTHYQVAEIASNAINKKGNLQICKFLMDQKFIAGIGNYIKCEALYATHVHPDKPIEDIGPDGISDIVMEAKRVAKLSLKVGGNTIRNYVDANGKTGTFSNFLQVYGKRKDPEGRPIIQITSSDKRTTHIVEEIQKIDNKYERIVEG